jgi:hypothetical protein
VLVDNPDLIISAGESFVVEKEVEIDGFVSYDDENIKILVNMYVDYYRQIPKADVMFDTAAELTMHNNTYLTKMGLPISMRVPRSDNLYVDQTEAQENGVSGWFDFTRETE